MNRLLLLLLAIPALLSVGYARCTPVGGAPDEGAHLQYVKILATEGRMPALNMTKRRGSYADPNYEAHQPPVYYGLAVPFYHAGKAIAGDTGAAQGARVLSMLFGLLGVVAVWSIVRELLPGRPAVWGLASAIVAFLPMRLHVVSSVSNDAAAEATASLALLLMVRAMTRAWGLKQAAWLGLAIAVAFLTKQGNLMLLPPALVILFLASRFTGATVAAVEPEPMAPAETPARKSVGKMRTDEPKGQKNRGKAKTEPAPVAAAAPSAAGEGEWLGLFLKSCLVVGGIFAALTGWWLLRNQSLYGDPLAKKAFDWYFADTTLWEQFRAGGFTFMAYLERKVFPTTFATFWGAFGHLDPRQPYFFMGAYGPGAPGPRWGYPPRSWTYELLWYLVLLSLLGIVAYLVQRRLQLTAQKVRRTEEPADAERARAEARSAALGVLGIHAVFVLAVYLNFNSTYFQAQGRYLFPAIAIFSLGLAAGWLQWGRTLGFMLNSRLSSDPVAWEQAAQKWERVGAWLWGTGMLVLAVYALVGVLDPAFNAPPNTMGSFAP